MEASQIPSADLSLTLQYLGIHFQQFVFVLQGTAGEPIPQEVDWHQHVLAEVVCIKLYHILLL